MATFKKEATGAEAAALLASANAFVQANHAAIVDGAKSYATDGRCHNSERGWMGQECGKPADWIGTKPNGWRSGFCDLCKTRGFEARGFTSWEAVKGGR